MTPCSPPRRCPPPRPFFQAVDGDTPRPVPGAMPTRVGGRSLRRFRPRGGRVCVWEGGGVGEFGYAHAGVSDGRVGGQLRARGAVRLISGWT